MGCKTKFKNCDLNSKYADTVNKICLNKCTLYGKVKDCIGRHIKCGLLLCLVVFY